MLQFKKTKTWKSVKKTFQESDTLILVEQSRPHTKGEKWKESLQVCYVNFMNYQWLFNLLQNMATFPVDVKFCLFQT